MAKKKTPNNSPEFVDHSKNLPVTQHMLKLVRTELKSDINGLKSEMNSQFKQVDARLYHLDSKIEHISAQVSRIEILVEEQNSKNDIVLEGLSGLFHRQERLEVNVEESKKLFQSILVKTNRN